MANVPYVSGAPDVAPAATPPDDYQHIQTTPDMFGAAVARGLQKVGEGASSMGAFWGEVQTDGVLNNSMKQLNDLAEKAKSLQGQDALDAQAGIKKQLDDIMLNGRSQLKTPEQQHHYDNTIRPFALRNIDGQLNTHFVQQAKVHATSVNDDAFKQALNNLANASDNPDEVAKFREDARAARVKQVQLEGNGNDPTAVSNAITSADQASIKTWAETLRAKGNPVGAVKVLDDNQKLLGVEYAPLRERMKAQADVVNDQSEAKTVIGRTAPGAARVGSVPGASTPALPLFTQTAAANPGGFSAAGLARTAHIESGGNAGITNKSGAAGLMQFVPSTWKQYGIGSPLDATAATEAAQRLAVANVKVLTPVLGRAPTDAELYVAHQQGTGGAKLLFQNPNTRAGDLVGDSAIRSNGGDPNKPASAFTSMWINKFNGGPGASMIVPGGGRAMHLPAIAAMAGSGGPAAEAGIAAQIIQQPVDLTPEGTGVINAALLNPSPASVSPNPPQLPEDPEDHRARAVNDILTDPRYANDPVRQKRVLAQVEFEFKQRAIAFEATKAARKDKSERKAGDYITQYVKAGQVMTPDLYTRILSDTELDVPTRLSLGEKLSKMGPPGDTSSYGPAWADVRHRIMLPPDDPQHMTFQDVLHTDGITPEGLDEIVKTQKRNKDGIGGSLITKLTNRAISYIGDKMQLKNEFGVPNPEAKRIFDGTISPLIIQRVDDFAAAGDRKGMEAYLKPDNLDSVIEQQYPRSLRNAGLPPPVNKPIEPRDIPRPPAGIESPDAWTDIISAVPKTSRGQAWRPADWANAVQRLHADPSPEKRREFDEYMKGRGVPDAATILRRLNPPKGPPTRLPEGTFFPNGLFPPEGMTFGG